jgi:hypothetical protein
MKGVDFMVCEGECDKHYGEVQHVHVFTLSQDWGYFNYCDNAIAKDRSNGFTVEIIYL